MKFVKQFLIIAAVSLVGEILQTVVPLPISASVWGVVLMFLCLEMKIIKVEAVKEVSAFLIEIMPVMFIPAAVGLLDSYQLIVDKLLAYIIILVLTTFTVMAVSGRVTQMLLKVGAKDE